MKYKKVFFVVSGRLADQIGSIHVTSFPGWVLDIL